MPPPAPPPPPGPEPEPEPLLIFGFLSILSVDPAGDKFEVDPVGVGPGLALADAAAVAFGFALSFDLAPVVVVSGSESPEYDSSVS